MARLPFQADPVLTALAISYRNSASSYVADDFLPRTPVSAERFGWTRFPVGQSVTVPETRVGRTSRPNRIEFEGLREVSEIMDYGLDTPVPQTDILNYEGLRARGLSVVDPLQVATNTLSDLILVDRELRAATIGQNPANFAPGNAITLPAENMFDAYTSPKSDPIQAIQGAIKAHRFFPYNTMTMGYSTFVAMQSHPKIVNAVKGNVTSSGIVSKEEMRQLFGMDKLLVGMALLNTARPGQNAVLSRVWGQVLVLTYTNPNANVDNPTTFGMTAEFGTRIAGTLEDPDIGIRGGQRVRVGEQVRELVTAPDAGYLILGTVAPPA